MVPKDFPVVKVNNASWGSFLDQKRFLGDLHEIWYGCHLPVISATTAIRLAFRDFAVVLSDVGLESYFSLKFKVL